MLGDEWLLLRLYMREWRAGLGAVLLARGRIGSVCERGAVKEVRLPAAPSAPAGGPASKSRGKGQLGLLGMAKVLVLLRLGRRLCRFESCAALGMGMAMGVSRGEGGLEIGIG